MSRCGLAAVVGRGCWVFRRGKNVLLSPEQLTEGVMGGGATARRCSLIFVGNLNEKKTHQRIQARTIMG